MLSIMFWGFTGKGVACEHQFLQQPTGLVNNGLIKLPHLRISRRNLNSPLLFIIVLSLLQNWDNVDIGLEPQLIFESVKIYIIGDALLFYREGGLSSR